MFTFYYEGTKWVVRKAYKGQNHTLIYFCRKDQITMRNNWATFIHFINEDDLIVLKGAYDDMEACFRSILRTEVY